MAGHFPPDPPAEEQRLASKGACLFSATLARKKWVFLENRSSCCWFLLGCVWT